MKKQKNVQQIKTSFTSSNSSDDSRKEAPLLFLPQDTEDDIDHSTNARSQQHNLPTKLLLGGGPP